MTFYKETEFQDTSIGKIPKDWEVGDASLINVLKGYAFSSEFFNGKKDGIPLIRIRDLAKKETESHYSGRYDPAYLVKKGDILISMDGEFDVYLWDGPEGLLNQRVCKVWSKETAKLNTIFLFYELQKPLKILESQISQTTVKHLLDRDLERIKIPVPSLEEQRAIVGVLGVVDSAIELVDKVIAKTERLKKGLMQTLLTKGIGHTEYKDTPIGKTPKTWQIVKIGDIAETSSGGTPSRARKEYFEGNIPWVKSGELKDNTIYDTEEKITKEGLQNSAAKMFPKRTLLTAMYGATVGKTAILGIDATTNQAICAILPKDDAFDPQFLRYYIVFRREQMIAISAGGAQPNISQEIIRATKITLPPLQEQRKIADILSTADKKLELERAEKARLERAKRGFMDLLLTGKVRVKVD